MIKNEWVRQTQQESDSQVHSLIFLTWKLRSYFILSWLWSCDRSRLLYSALAGRETGPWAGGLGFESPWWCVFCFLSLNLLMFIYFCYVKLFLNTNFLPDSEVWQRPPGDARGAPGILSLYRTRRQHHNETAMNHTTSDLCYKHATQSPSQVFKAAVQERK